MAVQYDDCRMSRNYFASMANPTTYPYSGNYGSLYWPSQSENQVNGYFDSYRLPSSAIPAPQAYPTHCKYTEADSTQQSAVEPLHLAKPAQVATEARSSPHASESHGNTLHLSRPNNSKRKPTPVCDERKDQHYYDRRNRNNESAKKSRMNRKQREEQNAFRCLCLERENLQLRQDIRFLEEENKKLRCLSVQFTRN